jgi:hypothetical protein
VRGDILQAMQLPSQTGPSPVPSGFAGLLASFTSSPESDPEEVETLWSGVDLGEDVATLGYEQSLRHPRDHGDRPFNQNTATVDAQDAGDGEEIQPGEGWPAEPGAAAAASADRDYRKASVTIRLSEAESVRLRRRAAEAGLTVSAYLRSCVLEADALRAQVKQALAEIRSGNEGKREQGNKKTTERGGKGASQCENAGVRITRTLFHLGGLWIGIASGESS